MSSFLDAIPHQLLQQQRRLERDEPEIGLFSDELVHHGFAFRIVDHDDLYAPLAEIRLAS